MSGKLASLCLLCSCPISRSHLSARCLHLNSVQQHKNSLDQGFKLQKINRVHRPIRNDVSGQFRPFYRGGKMYEPKPWQAPVDPLSYYQSHQYDNVSNIKSSDDVYVVSHYQPEVYSAIGALEHLKRIAELDFIESDSYIIMKIQHVEVLRGKGNRKKPFYYSFTKKLPHETNYKNKVCVFTDDEDTRNEAMAAGACAAGGRDLIIQIIQRKLVCDHYICTVPFFEVIDKNPDLRQTLGIRFPAKREATNEFVPLLNSLVNETIFTNYDGATQCKVVIGQLKESNENLKRNMLFALEKLTNAQGLGKVKEKLLNSVSLSSFTEYIPFDFDALLESDDE